MKKYSLFTYIFFATASLYNVFMVAMDATAFANEQTSLPGIVEENGDTVLTFPLTPRIVPEQASPIECKDPLAYTLTALAGSIVESVDKKGQCILDQGQATSLQIQETLKQLQGRLNEMKESQKKQRNLNRISFGIGLCGFSLFLANFMLQRYQEPDCEC